MNWDEYGTTVSVYVRMILVAPLATWIFFASMRMLWLTDHKVLRTYVQYVAGTSAYFMTVAILYLASYRTFTIWGHPSGMFYVLNDVILFAVPGFILAISTTRSLRNLTNKRKDSR